MSAISDYTARVNAKFDSIGELAAALGTALGGIADDVLFLKEKIEEIQNNPGPISPADQALLDASEERLSTLVTNLGALNTAAEQLNAATERPAPPADPPAEPS